MKNNKSLKEIISDLFYSYIIPGILVLAFIVFLILVIVDDFEKAIDGLITIALVVIGFISYKLYKKIKYTVSPKEKILVKCESLIFDYEYHLSVGAASCKSIVLPLIQKELTKQQVDKDNIEKESNVLLRKVCFSLLTTGEFNLYRGELGTMGYGSSLFTVFNHSSNWLIAHGWLSQAKHDEDVEYMKDGIRYSG